MTFPEPWVDGKLDEQLLAERNQYILDAATAEGIEWVPITTQARGRRGTFYVSSDALQVEGVRVTVDALTSQRIADKLGAALNTTRTSDLAWEACVPPLVPQELGGTPDMESTAKMLEHSKLVDAAAKGRTGLLRTVGKDWVIHPRMAANPAVQAINYGWHWARAASISYSGLHMVQTVGTKHNTKHVDYSQTLCLVRGDMLVDGELKSFDEVLRDPELAWLVSDDGSLKATRYALPEHAPAGKEVARVGTPTDPLSLSAIVRDAHNAAFGSFPSSNRLGVAWSQVMHENGRGNAIWNHNYANIAAGSTWTGDFYVLDTKPPDPPSMHFRSYPDHLAGARGYWDLLARRYQAALDRFDAGDAVGAAHELKAHGFFTAAEAPYARDLLLLFREFETAVLPRL